MERFIARYKNTKKFVCLMGYIEYSDIFFEDTCSLFKSEEEAWEVINFIFEPGGKKYQENFLKEVEIIKIEIPD